MTVVNTNIKALYAQQSLATSQRNLNHAMLQLATGQRITSAADDAAGTAISVTMATQVQSLGQSVRNANDAISMLQTADGAAQGISDILHRMKELTVQYLNGTNGSDALNYIQTEFGNLTSQMSSIVTNTKWNGINVLATASSKSYQVGSDPADTVIVDFTDFSSSSNAVYAAYSLNLNSTSAATSALSSIESAVSAISSSRAAWGAGISALQYGADNASNVSMNLSVSRSRIQDADYANATAELARAQIVQQAGTAMLTQANQLPYMVMSLLR